MRKTIQEGWDIGLSTRRLHICNLGFMTQLPSDDWAAYEGPSAYDPAAVHHALVEVLACTSQEQGKAAYSSILSAIGNTINVFSRPGTVVATFDVLHGTT